MADADSMHFSGEDCDWDSETESEMSVNDSGSSVSLLDDDSSESSVDDLQPARQFFEIDCDNPPPPPPRFAFTGSPEIHLNIDMSAGKLQFYDVFMDDYLLDITVRETNRYAEQSIIQNGHLRRHSRSKKWEPTTKGELQVFFALNILQGIVKKPTLKGKRIRKETRYYCPDCDVGLCLTPCFKLYHTKADL